MGWARENVPGYSAVSNALSSIDDAIIQPVVHTVEDVVSDPNKLIMVATAIVAPAYLPLVSGGLQLAQGHSIEDAAKAAATSYVAQGIGQAVGALGDQVGAAAEYGTNIGSQQTAMLAAQNAGMGTLGDVAGNIAGGTAASIVRGQDPLLALVSSGVSSGTSAVTSQIPGFSSLPVAAQRAVNTVVSAELTGKDPSQALINSAINLGIAEARNQITNTANANAVINPYFASGAGTGALPSDASSTTADAGTGGLNTTASNTATDNTATDNTGALNTVAANTTPQISVPFFPNFGLGSSSSASTGDNTSTEVAGSAATDSDTTATGGLPGINLAANDTGTVSDAGSGLGTIEVSGVPIYADSRNADTVRPPFGYDLMPMSLSDSRPEGAYYDITQNAWFMPNTEVSNLNDALVSSLDRTLSPIGTPGASSTTGGLNTITADYLDDPNQGPARSADWVSPVNSGLGSDAVSGGTGAGNDTLVGSSGSDSIVGGLGTDTVSGGTNTVVGGSGSDSVSGVNNDTVGGGDGVQEVVITAPRDTVVGGSGTDTVAGGSTTVTGGTGSTGTGATTLPSTSTTSPLSSGTTSTSSTNPFGIIKLDSSPQFLKSEMPKENASILLGLHQLFNSLDPEMKSVFADRGITPPGHQMEDTTNAATGGLIRAASGGLISEEAQKTLDSLLPKFSKSSTHLAAAPVIQQESRLSPLKYLRQGITAGRGTPGGLAHGGLPQKYAKAAPEGHEAEFITGLTGYYAQGGGTGQSDDIPAMLHDGDYVMDADTVAALGDGSSKAGAEVLEGMRKQIHHHDTAAGSPVPAKIADGEYVFPAAFVTAIGGGSNKVGSQRLDEMREKIRAHKRSAPTSKIPPKAKSPLDYLKMAKG